MHNLRRHIFLTAFAFFSLLVSVKAQDDPPLEDSSSPVVEVPMPDDDNSPFTAIETQQPVQIKQVSPATVEQLKKDEDYWYANLEPEKKQEVQKVKPSNSKSIFDEPWFANLLWIVILCSFIAVVIWYLASSNIQLFRKAPKKILEDEAEEEMGNDLYSINYEKEIQKAVDAANYRLAVRLWYLRTLKELAERNIIAYSDKRTNSDYIASLWGGRYYRDFFRLTRNFEYTWYGQFQLSAEGYDMMRKDFSAFKNSLA